MQRDLGVALVAQAAVASALAVAFGWGVAYALAATVAFALAIAVVWRSFARSFARSFPRAVAPSLGPPASLSSLAFGAANRVTLLRLALAMLLAAMLFIIPPQAPAWLPWAMVGLATVAALLDAVDGPLARTSGLASPFGARFDMETDAWLVLVLAVLAWKLDRAGAWVLASGAMRYAFVAAGRLWPCLSAPLAPSRLRQTVCVVQIAALMVALAPLWPRWAASAFCAAGLALLTASFALDVWRLWRHRHVVSPACHA